MNKSIFMGFSVWFLKHIIFKLDAVFSAANWFVINYNKFEIIKTGKCLLFENVFTLVHFGQMNGNRAKKSRQRSILPCAHSCVDVALQLRLSICLLH